MRLIDKSALVAEIEKLKEIYSKCPTRNNYEEGLKEGRQIGYKDALHKINTLEVKEVDLVKETERFVQTKEFIESTESPAILIAKHFFKLGMQVSNKTQKGE